MARPINSFVVGILAAVAFGSPLNLFAHPVPRSNHDRKIRVQLIEAGRDLIVRVDYRLEVDELTVVLDDMKPFADRLEPAKYTGSPLKYYAEYAAIYGPILAKNLVGKLGGEPLNFTYIKATPTLRDEKGQNLGHLRCDFVLEARTPIERLFEGPRVLNFRDATFFLQEGDVDLSLDPAGPWKVRVIAAPSPELIKRPALERGPGDDERLRELRAMVTSAYEPLTKAPDRYESSPELITAAPERVGAAPASSESPVEAIPAHEHAAGWGDHSLFQLIQSDLAFTFMLLLAAAFGAAHALTPGHGKTLVAAYLVGQRGTVWHAIALGLISTLTHTWSVLVLAGIVHWFGLSPAARAWIQSSLPLLLGLMIVCFGFMLLLQRLTGRADHIHIGGGHHHHHHGHVHDHSHGHSHAPAETNVTWGGLILLGVTGSIIPCWDAIAMLVWSIGADRLTWAVPLLLAFSAGLAAVLVTIGILVVKMRGFADSQFGESRLVKWLPIASAIAIIVLGFWLCRQAVTPAI